VRILVIGGAGFIGAKEGTPDRYAASVRRLVEQVLAET
jgi:nucleoside-diphosphate-sugar epimerase